MPKIKIRVTIENETDTVSNELVAIYQDNILKYKEKEGATVVFDYNKRLLKREDKLLRDEFDMNKETIKVEYKEIPSNMNIKVKIIELKQDNINFEIKYEIDNTKEEYIYRIEELK